MNTRRPVAPGQYSSQAESSAASPDGSLPEQPAESPADGPAPLLQIRDLHQRFQQSRFSRHQVVHALNGVSLELYPGETLGIVGETGCGKSTLCRTLMGLYKPHSGQILLEGRDIVRPDRATARHLRQTVQMVFQDPADSMNPRLNVEAIVAEPLVIQTGRSEVHHRTRVESLLQDVGLPRDILDRYPHEFSGGQRQRLAIARALILNPRILVCDEPVSALDVSVQAQILNLLLDMQAEHRLSMIFVSHALGIVRHMSDRIAVMYLGTIVEEGPGSAIYRQPAHPYTRRLLEAHPGLEDIVDPAGTTAGPAGGPAGATASAAGDRARAPGAQAGDRASLATEAGRALPDNLEPPSPVRLPVGCPYQAACPLVIQRCVAERPVLRSLGQGQRVACHRV